MKNVIFKFILFGLVVNFANGVDDSDFQCKNTTFNKNDSGNCHCIELIVEAYIKYTEGDMTRQLNQMNIDQQNFQKHFLEVEMRNGLKNELGNTINAHEQTLGTINDYDELVFLSKKLVEELEITNKYGTVDIKSDTVESMF